MTTPVITANPHQMVLDLLDSGTVRWCSGALGRWAKAAAKDGDSEAYEGVWGDDDPYHDNDPIKVIWTNPKTGNKIEIPLTTQEFCAVGLYGKACLPEEHFDADSINQFNEAGIMRQIADIYGMHAVEEIATILIRRYWKLRYKDSGTAEQALEAAKLAADPKQGLPSNIHYLSQLIFELNDEVGFDDAALREALTEAAASYEARH